MDPMKRVAAGAVRKNLGPDPSMGQKVELLRRLVSMRKDGPKARTNPPRRGGYGKRRPAERMEVTDGGMKALPGRSVPTRLPRRDQMPAQFAGRPGYNFGPPRGM